MADIKKEFKAPCKAKYQQALEALEFLCGAHNCEKVEAALRKDVGLPPCNLIKYHCEHCGHTWTQPWDEIEEVRQEGPGLRTAYIRCPGCHVSMPRDYFLYGWKGKDNPAEPSDPPLTGDEGKMIAALTGVRYDGISKRGYSFTYLPTGTSFTARTINEVKQKINEAVESGGVEAGITKCHPDKVKERIGFKPCREDARIQVEVGRTPCGCVSTVLEKYHDFANYDIDPHDLWRDLVLLGLTPAIPYIPRAKMEYKEEDGGPSRYECAIAVERTVNRIHDEAAEVAKEGNGSTSLARACKIPDSCQRVTNRLILDVLDCLFEA